MLTALRNFRALCSDRDVMRLWWLLAIVIITGVLEVAGIASVVPFLQLAASPEAISERPWLNRLFLSAGLTTHHAMLVATGCAVIVLLTVSNLLAIVAGWQRQRIAWNIAHNVSMGLARSYAALPYAFYLNRDSADLIKSVVDDVQMLVDGVVIAGCQFVSQMIMVAMILSLLATVNGWVALSALVVFAGIYLLIYLTRRRFLTRLGRERLSANTNRYITFADLMNGIKAIKSNGVSEFFLARFEKPSRVFSETQPKIFLSTSTPRYLVEAVAFGAVIGIVMFLSGDEQNFVHALPTLTLFALAGYRLMPAINIAYVSLAQISSSYPAIESIYRDVHAAAPNRRSVADATATPEAAAPLALTREIRLQAIQFTYPQSDRPVLNEVSFQFAKGQKVAVVGPSGSGKTTLVDMLTGMLAPDSGQLVLDDTPVNASNMAAWQAIVGYVPQEVFIYNDTVAGNVAFGQAPVDMARVREACRLAQIAPTIENDLADGYDTRIGERGLRLSGGQRQRLGLARALYRAPQVLVLDEATSALDSQTEARVIAAIHDELPDLTIVMIAHRLSTVRRCDQLFVINFGRLVAQGTFDELLANDALFRELVGAA